VLVMAKNSVYASYT